MKLKLNLARIITAFAVSVLMVMQTASAQSSKEKTAPITVSVAAQTFPITSLAFSPPSVAGGSPTVGTVTLNQVVPTGTAKVTLTSSAPLVLSVPSYVLVYGGFSSATFVALTNTVNVSQDVVITATCGTYTQTSTVTVQPLMVSSVALSPSTVIGSNSSTATVTINTRAPAGGLQLVLNSDNSNATIPARVSIAAGASTGTFNISTSLVTSTQVANIKASVGAQSASAPLTINPFVPSSVLLSPSSVFAGQSSSGTVTINGPAPSGGLTVNLSATSGAGVPSSVSVVAGATTANFSVTTGQVASTTNSTITASTTGGSATGMLTITALVPTISLSPTAVTGGSSSTGTITLNGPAPTGGLTVSLSATNGVSVPSSITVAAGGTSATFTASAPLVANTTASTITATATGGTSNATLTINPLVVTGLALSPSTINNSSSTGTVTLNGPAPTGGISVALTSQFPSYVSINGSSAAGGTTLTIAAGQTSGTFPITTSQMWPVAFTDWISAAYNGSAQTSTLSVNTYAFQSVSLAASAIDAGGSTTATVTLGGPAPAGGWPVSFTATNANVIVPATVTVPAGQTTTTFTVSAASTSPALTNVTISGHDSVIYHSATISVLSDKITGLSVGPNSIAAGSSTTGTITLQAVAPAGGWTVNLSAAVPSLVTVPTSVLVPAGSSTVTFPITTKATSSTLTIGVYATCPTSSASTTVTINGNSLVSVSVNPTSVTAGGSVIGTVTINTAAGTGGWTVNLSAGVPSEVTLPASVVVPAGATSTTFTINTKVTSSTLSVGIYGADGVTSKSTLLAINGDSITGLSLSPTSVKGGTSSTATITLASPAPAGGWLVNVTVGVPGNLTVPATVLVPAGSSTAQFTITTKAVGTTLTSLVAVSDTVTGKNTTLTVTP